MIDDGFTTSGTSADGVELLMQAVEELSDAKDAARIDDIVRTTVPVLEAGADGAQLVQALTEAASIATETLAAQQKVEQRVRDRTAELEQKDSPPSARTTTDDLTGLLNRRGFFAAAEARLAGARVTGSDCVVAFIDLDGLTKVNETHGHQAGDSMVAHLATSLRSVLRDGDLIARLSGDEFCALVIAPPSGGADLAERLRERLDGINSSRVLEFELSASVGLVSTSELPDATVDELLLQADQRMHTHKRARGPRA